MFWKAGGYIHSNGESTFADCIACIGSCMLYFQFQCRCIVLLAGVFTFLSILKQLKQGYSHCHTTGHSNNNKKKNHASPSSPSKSHIPIFKPPTPIAIQFCCVSVDQSWFPTNLHFQMLDWKTFSAQTNADRWC